MTRKVEVVPYDPRWAALFEREARAIASVMGGQALSVHHVGSTAVPGLCAKPTIDILVEVGDIRGIDQLNEGMAALGYQARGEWGISGRRYFVKHTGSTRTHHVHMFQRGHPEIERHLGFRDYLLAHPEEAQAYGRLKKRLSQEFPFDAKHYTEGKTEFIQGIDELAKKWRRGG